MLYLAPSKNKTHNVKANNLSFVICAFVKFERQLSEKE